MVTEAKMQIGQAIGWLCLVYLTIPLTGWAKGETTKIEIQGEGLGTAIEITDPGIVERISIWNGPQVMLCDANANCVAQTDPEKTSAIVDWPRGIAIEPPGDLTRYLVDIHIGGRENLPRRSQREFRFWYVPGAASGYVYLPDFSDKEMRNEIITNGIEGDWFHASARWEALVRPIIEKTAKMPLQERSDTEVGKMSFMALEISVNGKRLYTVGAEDWRMLTAHIWGHRITPDLIPPEILPPGEEVPEGDSIGINFTASVSVPEDENEIPDSAGPQTGKQFSSESYRSRRLNVGDVVAIKVIETDVADEPNGPKADPRFPGATVLRADPEPE